MDAPLHQLVEVSLLMVPLIPVITVGLTLVSLAAVVVILE